MKNTDISRPRSISEIKKLQSFVKSYKSEEGKSLNQSIRKLAARDESFNEFLKSFKAKNEQGWANIIDLTQEQQENKLLEVTPEMRKNQMIMLEEFRRRKNLENYWNMTTDMRRGHAIADSKNAERMPHDMDPKTIAAVDDYQGSNVERFFEP